jgi:O-antigen/teichoic acid export membrane protein
MPTSVLALVTLATKVAAAGVTYLFTLILARTMKVSDFGVVGTLMSATFLLSVAGSLGQRIALLRFVPQYLDNPDRTILTSLIGRAFAVAAVGTTLPWLVLSIGAGIAGAYGLVDHWPILALGFVLIPLQGWVDMQAHLSRAYHAIVLALLPKEVLWRAIAGACVLGVFFANSGARVSLSTVVALLVVTLLALILGQLYLMYKTLAIPRINLIRSPAIPESWRSTIVPFWLFSLSSILFLHADVIVVGLMFGGEPAGYYFVANRISVLLTFFSMSYNIVIGPMLPSAFHSGSVDKVRAIVFNATYNCFLPTAVAGLAIVILAPYILLLFGEAFEQATTVLQLLVVANVINAAFGPSDIVLNMCGREREAMQTNVATMIFGIGLILAGGWAFGPVGVAAGVVGAVTAKKLVMWWQAAWLLEIRTDVVAAIGHMVNSSNGARARRS